jgi:hypothetical protein
MAMSLLERNKWANHLAGIEEYTMPTALYIGLFTTAPDENGEDGVEVNGGGYARQLYQVGTTKITTGQLVNISSVIFPVATIDWGSIVTIGLFGDDTGDNLKFFETLDSPITIAAGSQYQFATGNAVVSMV